MPVFTVVRSIYNKILLAALVPITLYLGKGKWIQMSQRQRRRLEGCSLQPPKRNLFCIGIQHSMNPMALT